jgi:hypothetical protein
MLPSFRVPIVLSGESHHLLVRDVSACVFWQGYPDPASEAPARDQGQALAAWLRHLLVRVTVKPALDLDWVLTWGDDYERPILRYLDAVGFTPQPVVAAVEPGKLLDRGDVPAEPETLADHAAFRGCVPPAHVQHIFRQVARSTGVPAVQLWLGWASEFFFDYHVHLTDEEKAGVPLPEVKR